MYCLNSKPLLVAVFFALQTLSATTVVINGTASHKIPPTLWGAMFEDINSGDGGLYGELLQNRAFQKVTPNTNGALNAWHSINGASLTVIADPTPVSSALPNSLQLSVADGTTGPVGFENEGYWGIKVDSSWTYKASFYYRFAQSSDKQVTATVSLISVATGESYTSETAILSAADSGTWNKVSLSLKPGTSADSTANYFAITLNGEDVAGLTINFAMFSLFPPTFNDRENGLRLDLGEALKEMGPKLFRFPGGNNLGGSTATRWKWNETLGDVVNRPGRQGDWGYVNTDGLGFMEYLTFIEDLGMEPVMGIWAGYSLGGASEAEDALGPYIEDAKQQIYFVIGDPETNEAAALRASLGRKEPFKLNYIEVGNEDFFASTTYLYRWKQFYEALSAEFPQLTFLATTQPNSPVLDPAPPSYDVHVYQTPRWFASNSFYYDSFARDGKIYFEGEYAAISTNSGDIYGSPENGRLLYPTVWGSVGEAAFMTGLERNSDIVFSAAYAPLIQHVNGSQWTPDLLSFDAGRVYLSTSYYVQQMFSESQGDDYLPSTLPTADGTVFWSATRTQDKLFIKVSNTDGTPADLSFEIPSELTVSGTASLRILQGDQNASNSPSTPTAVVPATSSITVGQTFAYTAPGFSFSVIGIDI